MKKITSLDARLMPLTDEDAKKNELPTIRDIFRLIGNIKAKTADDSRRTMRLINQLRKKEVQDLILENEDIAFLQKQFEENAMNLTAWAQGQTLDLIDGAEKVEPILKS